MTLDELYDRAIAAGSHGYLTLTLARTPTGERMRLFGRSEAMMKALEDVLTGIIERQDDRLRTMGPERLEGFWFFTWDESRSEEWSLYEFHSMLHLYGRKCRRWEEIHNGSCCVVERVRDQYLMPKIKEFVREIRRRVGEEDVLK